MSGTWSYDDILGLIQLFGAAVAFGTLAVGYGQLRQQNSGQAGEIQNLRTRLDNQIETLSKFKERVALEYVNRETMRELEDRLVLAIEKMGERMEKVADRIDALLGKSKP